jgi:predicted ATPase
MNNIGFKNIKVFKDWQKFDFKNITLLTGTNNSGKSSVINTMQMLQENLTAKNLDELLATEFVLKANQNKYGTIGSFVNNKSKEECIWFKSNRGTFEFTMKLKVEKGIQPKATVDAVKLVDTSSNENIFKLIVQADKKVLLLIKYEYFLTEYYTKCENTIELYRRKKDLDSMIEKVNHKEISIEAFKDFAKEVSKKVGVYIVISTGQKEEYSYHFHCDNYYDIAITNDIGKFGVLTYKSDFLNSTQVMTEDNLKNEIMPVFEKGILDFSTLWDILPNEKDAFESLICNFYKQDLNSSYKQLSNNLVQVASNTGWEIKFNDNFDISPNLALLSTFCNHRIPDLGIFKRIWYDEFSNNEHSNIICKSGLLKIDEFEENGFYILIYEKIKELYVKCQSVLLLKELKALNEKKFAGIEIAENLIRKNTLSYFKNCINEKILGITFSLNNIYVSSSRFTTKRTYSFNDNTDFTNLLSQIENKKFNFNEKESIYKFINKWLKEFDIADELILIPDSDTGNFKAILKQNEIETLLSDYGLGTNQLLPIIFSLAIHEYYDGYDGETLRMRTVVIEEPEANLHPAMQSKLADMFADAIKTFKIKIIAETHSEYLIRKLQYLVANNNSEVKPDDVVIYYFNKPDNPNVLSGEIEQVIKIEIDEMGRLNKEFGKGFFDEADNIAMDLFLLQQSQSN